MPPSTDLVESDRQKAVELLDRLDQSAQSVDGRLVKAQHVFQQATETVEQICGFTPLIQPSESSNEPNPSLARFPLTESKSIALHHPDAKQSLDAPWQKSFLNSVVECCGVAYLKQHYAESVAASASPDRANTNSSRRSIQRIAAAIVAGILIAVIPVPFRLPTEGMIQPAVSTGVFAPMAGKLSEITVRDGMNVEPGDVLARIESPEIRLQAERLRGELLAAETDLIATRMNASEGTSRRESDRSSPKRSSAKVAVLRTRIASLKKQVALINEIEDSLVIRADAVGRVIIDDYQEDSLGQAVLQSQQLMTLADDSQGHQAVVQLPAKAFGYLDAAQTASLRLRSDPSRRFTGSVGQISNTVQVDQRGESVIEVTIELDPSPAEDVRIDSPVIGHVWLGRRSLGFVVFRPIIEFIRETSW